MTQQIINVGEVANDGLGDPLRDAFIKCNDNFTELYNVGGLTGIQNGNSNISIAANSSINMSSAGVADVLVVSETGITANGLIAGNTISVTGTITGNYITGNGAYLTGVSAQAPASLITGNTLSANVINSSLRTLGTLTSLSVSGAVNAGSTTVNGVLNVTGAASFGNGISATKDISTAGNIVANNVVSLNTVSFPALSLTGNVNAGNVVGNAVYSAGNVSAGGNVVVPTVVTNTITTSGALLLNPTGNINVNNHYINNLATPVQAYDAATKTYVDSAVSGLNIHPSANAATTSDLATYTGATVNYNNGTSGVGATLSIVGNTLSILDGVPLSNNDRLLIKNEGNAVYNGVYVVNSNTLLTRATDFDTTAEASPGSYVFVTAGTQNGSTGWTQTTTSPVIGVSNLVFAQFSGGGTSYLAGTGLSLTGTTFSIADTAVTAASYGNASAIATFTVNQQGQLTAAAAVSVVAPAAYISGTTLSSNVTDSSLTSVGTLEGLNVNGATVSSSFTTTGNVLASNFNGTSLSLTGNVISTLRVTDDIIADNITAVTTLSAIGGIETSANVAGDNINGTSGVFSGGVISAIGNITGSYLLGNGRFLSGMPVTYSNANVAAYLPTYSGNLTANIISAAGNIATSAIVSATGNINTAAGINADGNIGGGNILASGLVVGLTISAVANVLTPTVSAGNITATGSVLAGVVSASGNITGNYLLGNVSLASGLPEAYSNAKVVANIASLGSNPVSTTGNISAGYYFGNIAFASGVPATYGNAQVVANIAALGTNPVSTTGNVNAGNLVADTAVVTGSITHTGSNSVGNIGSSSSYFDTFFGTAMYALYADLAENYAADREYAPGTVLCFDGSQEVTLCVIDQDTRVAGVVSTHPAQLMNSAIDAEFPAAVALQGRVPVSVVGTVRKGDMMVSAGDGAARAEANPKIGAVIGKSLQNFDGESGVIEVVVGRV